MKEIDRLGKLDWKETERAIAGPLTIQGALQGDEDKAALTVNGSGAKSLLTIKNNGAVELNGPLTVSQKLTVSQNLEVQGELSGPLTDPNKKLTVSGDLEILGKATSQKLTVSQNLEVQGELSGPLTAPNKKLTVSGALEVSGKATFKGDMSLGDQDQDKLTIAGTLQSQHSSGALQIADALHVTENLTIDGNVGIGVPIPNAKLEVKGDLKLGAENGVAVNGFFNDWTQATQAGNTAVPTATAIQNYVASYVNQAVPATATKTIQNSVKIIPWQSVWGVKETSSTKSNRAFLFDYIPPNTSSLQEVEALILTPFSFSLKYWLKGKNVQLEIDPNPNVRKWVWSLSIKVPSNYTVDIAVSGVVSFTNTGDKTNYFIDSPVFSKNGMEKGDAGDSGVQLLQYSGSVNTQGRPVLVGETLNAGPEDRVTPDNQPALSWSGLVSIDWDLTGMILLKKH
jgi:cytoskeletal protein CcmA (bactofilin family)